MDEEYEQALMSSSSTASVKDEPNTARVRHTLLKDLWSYAIRFGERMQSCHAMIRCGDSCRKFGRWNSSY